MKKLLCGFVMSMAVTLAYGQNASTVVNNCAYGVDIYYNAPACKGGWNLYHLNPGDSVSAHYIYTLWGCNTAFESQLTWSPNNTGTPVYQAQSGTNAAGTCGALAAPVSTNCSTLIIKNVDPVPRWFLVYTNGNPWQTDYINPGATKTFQYCVTNGTMIVTADRFALGGSDASDGHYTGTQSTNGVPSATGQNVGGDPSSGIQYGGSTTNINWGTNTPDVGDSALYDLIQKIGQQAHSDAQTIAASAGSNGASASVNVSLTNNLTVQVTNTTDLSGVTNNLSALLDAATNNGPGGSYSNAIMGKLSGGATNWSVAEGVVNGILNGIGIGSDVTTLAGKYEAPDVGDSGAPDMSLTFCGQILNLDPAIMFPGAVLVCYWGLTLIAYLQFGRSVAKLFSETVRGFQTQQLGGVPDMEVMAATFGGNVAGVAVALIVPIVFVGGFALMMHVVFGILINSIIGALHFSDFKNGLGSVGFYLLSTFFPLQTVLSLACTRITMQFTIGNLVIIASGVSRFLFGK